MEEPTDRSMPPEIISTVMPIERMPSVETCWSTLRMFRAERKTGEAMPMMMIRTMRTRTIPHCWTLANAL